MTRAALMRSPRGCHGIGLSCGPAVRGQSHPCPLSTWPTGGNAEGFHGRQSPHPAPADLFHSLLALLLLAGLPQAMATEGHGHDDWQASVTERLPPWPVGPFVILRRGGVLTGRLTKLTQTHIELAPTGLRDRISLPLEGVAGYRQSPSLGPSIDADAAAGIIVALANGDRLPVSDMTLDRGTFRMLPAWKTSEHAAARPVAVPLDRILGFDRARPGLASHSDRWAALADGSRLPIARYEPASGEAGSETVRLWPADARLPQPLLCAAADIILITPATGLAWLQSWPTSSDVAAAGTPRAQRPRGPQEATTLPLSRGRTLTGHWPRLRGLTGFTALGIHAPDRLVFGFERPAIGFSSIVAVDDTAGRGGSVVVRVLAVNAAGETREAYDSPVLRGGNSPVAIDLNLDNAVRLELVVEPADAGSVLDRTLWLDPVVHFSEPGPTEAGP
jgi:hypothetical protein